MVNSFRHWLRNFRRQPVRRSGRKLSIVAESPSLESRPGQRGRGGTVAEGNGAGKGTHEMKPPSVEQIFLSAPDPPDANVCITR